MTHVEVEITHDGLRTDPRVNAVVTTIARFEGRGAGEVFRDYEGARVACPTPYVTLYAAQLAKDQQVD